MKQNKSAQVFPARQLKEGIWVGSRHAVLLSCVVVSAQLMGCSCEGEQPQPCPATDAGPIPPAVGEQKVPLAKELKEARASRSAQFAPPSAQEHEAYGEWLEGVAKAAWGNRLPETSAPAGFAGRLGDSGRLWLLQEQGSKKRGAGFVAIRPSTRSHIMVEAPHSFFDVGTLDIALRVFEGLGAKALLVNTMHRGGKGDADERMEAALSGESDFDVAHSEVSFFATAHESLTRLEPKLRAVQLHGFADRRAPGVKAIVSAAKSTADARTVAEALRRVFEPSEVRTYPDQIDILGGTTNAQARASRRMDAQFIHLELSASARKVLREKPAVLRAFVEALRKGMDAGT